MDQSTDVEITLYIPNGHPKTFSSPCLWEHRNGFLYVEQEASYYYSYNIPFTVQVKAPHPASRKNIDSRNVLERLSQQLSAFCPFTAD